MSWVRNGAIGGSVGLFLIMLALVYRTRQVQKDGLYVYSKYIPRDWYLHALLRQVAVCCKTSRSSVTDQYKKFIQSMDELVGTTLRGEQTRRFDHASLMQLLKDGFVQEPLTEVQEQLSAAIRQLVQLCIKKL